jgi:hypothetical protein
MTSKRALKTLARQRQMETGESYQEALAAIRSLESLRGYLPAPSTSPCVGLCQSDFLAADAAGRDAGSMVDCAHCLGPVCVECGRAPVAEAFASCATCRTAKAASKRDARLTARCAGRTCISSEQAGTSDADSASFICESCGDWICLGCGRVPVEDSLDFCDHCGEDADDVDAQWEQEDREQLLACLDDQIVRIARRGGGTLRQVRRVLDKLLGARRTDATYEQLHNAVSQAADWLSGL